MRCISVIKDTFIVYVLLAAFHKTRILRKGCIVTKWSTKDVTVRCVGAPTMLPIQWSRVQQDTLLQILKQRAACYLLSFTGRLTKGRRHAGTRWRQAPLCAFTCIRLYLLKSLYVCKFPISNQMIRYFIWSTHRAVVIGGSEYFTGKVYTPTFLCIVVTL